MARRKGRGRPFAPGAGQDAGQQRQQEPQPAEAHSFKGRDTGGQLHKQGEKRSKAPAPKPKTPAPKPRPSVPGPGSISDEAIAFSAAAARRGAPAPSAQRDRLIALGVIKEVTHV